MDESHEQLELQSVSIIKAYEEYSFIYGTTSKGRNRQVGFRSEDVRS